MIEPITSYMIYIKFKDSVNTEIVSCVNKIQDFCGTFRAWYSIDASYGCGQVRTIQVYVLNLKLAQVYELRIKEILKSYDCEIVDE